MDVDDSAGVKCEDRIRSCTAFVACYCSCGSNVYRSNYCLTAVMVLISGMPALGSDMSDLIGKWKWNNFVVEVTTCRANAVCAKVIAGPKNVGMEIFGSNLKRRGPDLFGRIRDPRSGHEYHTRFRPRGRDRWLLDGCTSSRICLSGEFIRMK